MLDYDDIMSWTPAKILDHMDINLDSKNDIHIIVKVLWRTGVCGWIRDTILMTEDPYLLIKYACKNRLIREEGWKWVLRYVKTPTDLPEIRTILSAARNEVIYKFGVLVPYSVKNALEIEIDNANGNTEWKNASHGH